MLNLDLTKIKDRESGRTKAVVVFKQNYALKQLSAFKMAFSRLFLLRKISYIGNFLPKDLATLTTEKGKLLDF